ncbi:PREDICTED: microtubule-associated protein TORTIFOLIA1-like [Nelumbo nucifera]|nr:PREDICTED: microtubule-associated protein TORTIFOLIA1-like [Nelumbo nucifera]
MLANIVRRLRDPDSAIRFACIDAVSAMASQITKPPFSVFLKPLTEALLLEQDYNSQIGSALCLASAIDASPDPDPAQLQRLLPRLLKLLRAECFKAKPALLSLIGSIVGAGGASSHNVLLNLIPCAVDFLSSGDWAARKAAAETLVKLAIVERNLLSEFKSSCITSFEARRFDKVKAVRDTMNRMLEAWKDVPGLPDEMSPPSQSKPSSRESASDGRFPPYSINSVSLGFETPQLKKKTISKSTPLSPYKSPETKVRKKSPLETNDTKHGKLECKKPSDWKIEIAVPHSQPFTVLCDDDVKQRDGKVLEENESRHGTKRALFNKNFDDKMYKFGGLRSGSRVVPFHDKEGSESTIVVSNTTEDIYGNHKDNEDLCLIRKQLVQIENQQSSLLDLLQKFIGSSQSGMRSLETRVHGLEMALDEISYDLAVSTGRMSKTDTAGNTCCMLPGAEFLSSRFWKRTDSRCSTSRFSSSGGTSSLAAMRKMTDNDGNAELFMLKNRRFRLQWGSGFVVNPLAEIHNDSTGSPRVYSNRMTKSAIQALEGRQGHNGSGLLTGLLPADAVSRSSA